MTPKVDIALVSLGTTPGLRHADEALAELLRGAGVSCRVVRVSFGRAGRLRRQSTVTDLVEALAARHAASAVEAGAVIYSTVTAALLQRPRVPSAVRFDSPAALNRRGPGGAWQRARERVVLRRATLLLPWGRAAARALPASVTASGGPAIVPLPVPVEELTAATDRDLDAVAYTGYPRKRGLELLCTAWAAAAPPGARLVIGGLDREKGRRWLERTRVPEPDGIEWAGALPRSEWLERLRRARVFVNASRWEDHGLAQLEALAAGAALVTVPSPGAYEALGPARVLDARLVARAVSADALATALATGLALEPRELAAYSARARALLRPYRHEAAARTVATEVLPALGIGR